MNNIDRTISIKNIQRGTLKQIEGYKKWWMDGLPYVLAATALVGLRELITLFHPHKVVYFSRNLLEASVYSLILGGIIKSYYSLDQQMSTLQGRKIEYVKMSREEFDRLQKEITSLKELRILIEKK